MSYASSSLTDYNIEGGLNRTENRLDKNIDTALEVKREIMIPTHCIQEIFMEG